MSICVESGCKELAAFRVILKGPGVESDGLYCRAHVRFEMPEVAGQYTIEIIGPLDERTENAMTTTKCEIRSCDQQARWRVRSNGHPNGDFQAWYCHDHAKTYPWDESPTPYSMTVEGPFSEAAVLQRQPR